MYCFLRDNSKLRFAIKYRMQSLNLDYKALAKIAGVFPYRVSAFLNDHDKKTLTQEQLLRICKSLGITVELKINWA